MARRVQGPPPGQEDWYTPIAYGNDRETEPVKVRLRFPTESDKRQATIKAARIDATLVPSENIDAANLPLSMGWLVAMQEVLIQRCVLEVQNYEDASGQPIKNGQDLAQHGEDSFIREIGDVLMRGIALTEAEKKTSDDLSDSHGSGSPSAGKTADLSVGADALKAHDLGKDGGTSQASGS